MKPPLAAAICFSATILFVIAGCGHRDGDGHAHAQEETGHAPETETGVTFSEKKGLSVSPETAKFIGLQIADVEERKLTATFQFSAQVYRPASEARYASLQSDNAPSALASGNVASADAARLHQGQTVAVRSGQDAAPYEARVVELTHHLEEASGQVEVGLDIADAQQRLASGAFVSVTVPFESKKDAVSVPRSSVLRTTEGDFVYTVSGEHFVRTPIKLGVQNADFAEVTDGLYAGDQIVVQPVMTLWMAELQSLRGGKACADGH